MKSKHLIALITGVLFHLAAFALISHADGRTARVVDNALTEDPGQADGALCIIEAVRDDIVSLTIDGGETEVTIGIRRQQQSKRSEEVRIVIPEGLLRLGFIHEGRFRTHHGWRRTQNHFGRGRPVGHTFKSGHSVFSNNLDSSGFSVKLDDPLALTIPADVTGTSGSTAGRLKIDVPPGFRPFMLAGISGTITSGRIELRACVWREGEDDEEKGFAIRYGDMEVKR